MKVRDDSTWAYLAQGYFIHALKGRYVPTGPREGASPVGAVGKVGSSGVAGQKGNREGDKQTFETSLNPSQGKPHYRKTSSPTIPAESRPRTPLVETASEQV